MDTQNEVLKLTSQNEKEIEKKNKIDRLLYNANKYQNQKSFKRK